MKSKNATRNALFSSIIALLLCVSMLVGTTFAWFTDKVESGVNTIAAGNLDIELYHKDKGTTDFTKVGNTTVLFDDVTPNLWEPGALAYENFMIKNEGTLALKYNMNLNVAEESEVNGNKLSDVILVGFKANGFTATTREGMIGEVESWTELSEFSLDGHGDLLTAGEEKVFGLVLYWQPNANEIDNLYNVKDEALNLKVGVELLATQQMKEEDSFGKDYDEDAWMDGFKVYDAQGLQAAIDAGEKNIQLEDNIDLTESLVIPAAASTFSLRAVPNAVTINLNGNIINVGYQEGSTTNHIYAFENYGNVVITGNGTINARGIFNYGNMVLESGTINAIDGNGGYAVRNYEGATFTMNGGTIATTLEDDHLVDAGGYDASTIRVDEGATFVMNGGVVNNICDWTAGIYNEGTTTINAGTVTSVHSTLGNEGGTMIINDGDFTCNGVEGKTQHVLYASSGSATTINGGTFNGKDNYNGFNVDAGAGAVVNIYGGNFLPVHSGSLYGEGTISVYGGTFFDDPNARVADGYSAVQDADGTYKVLPSNGLETVSPGLYYDKAETYYVTSAAGLAAVANEVNKVEQYAANIFDGKTVKLMADIDLGGIEWAPIGNFAITANDFSGIFDGQGHTVSNFVITQKSTDSKNRSSYGLFGNITNATIKNLTVDNATVDISGGRYAAALVGRMNNTSTIENCHVVNSNVTIYNWQVGGLVGQINGGDALIKDCSVEDTTVNGYAAAGILVGYQMGTENNVTTIQDCVVKGCDLVQNGSFGEVYDPMFGVVLGYQGSETIIVNVNGCVIEDTTIKGEKSSAICNSAEGLLVADGVYYVCNETLLSEAIAAGKEIVVTDNIALTKTLAPHNAAFSLDGNGYSVTMADGCVNTYALFDITGGKAAFKNVTFDGIKEGAVIRTVDVEFCADNVTVMNGEHTQQQGLFRLMGESTITNCTFKNNTCNMVISLNYDGANNDPQVIKNCVFEGNTCNATAVLYYVKGAGATIDGNKFVNNKVVPNGNGATVYMGFTENNVITNNVFSGNVVTATSKRSSGGLMIGYEAVITGNAFVDNRVISEVAKGNDVCASVYYTDIDLSGNYWGGEAPVENDDYFVEYPDNNKVIINDYLTVYSN